MARKLTLGPVLLNTTTSIPVQSSGVPAAATVSLAATFNSFAMAVPNQDNISIQILVTTTNSEGTFLLQGSNDGSNYDTIGTMGTVAAANDSIACDYTQYPYAYIRVRYVSSTAGTGTCLIYFMGRTVGA